MKHIKIFEDANEADKREKLIDRIDGFFGVLKSVPWNKVSTEDLEKMCKILDAVTEPHGTGTKG